MNLPTSRVKIPILLLSTATVLFLAASAAAIGPNPVGFCGDEICRSGETCSNCPEDCGACNICGDGICAFGETCSNCATDCGVCPPPAPNLVSRDYDGDGKTDISVKTDGGLWRIDFAANGFGAWDATFSGYGGADAKPAPADYDGDGKTDLSTKSDSGVWSIDYASNGFGAFDLTLFGYGLA